MLEPRDIFSHQIDETLKERQMKYPNVVEALDRILYLIEVSYRETQETTVNSDILQNPGNILATVIQITCCYLLLHKHIHSPLRRNVSFMSPTSQN